MGCSGSVSEDEIEERLSLNAKEITKCIAKKVIEAANDIFDENKTDDVDVKKLSPLIEGVFEKYLEECHPDADIDEEERQGWVGNFVRFIVSSLDIDNDGTITRSELLKATEMVDDIKILASFMTSNLMNEIWEKYAGDEEKVSNDDLASMFTSIKERYIEQTGLGFISAKCMGFAVDRIVAKVTARLDSDCSGYVEKDEFFQLKDYLMGKGDDDDKEEE